jgi:hypothetical protein
MPKPPRPATSGCLGASAVLPATKRPSKSIFQASEQVTAAVVGSFDNIIDLAAERAGRAAPSPPPLAPEAQDFRVISGRRVATAMP